MDDIEYAVHRLEVARGYDEYIPTEEESEYDQPEKEKFNNVLDGIERTLRKYVAERDDVGRLDDVFESDNE